MKGYVMLIALTVISSCAFALVLNMAFFATRPADVLAEVKQLRTQLEDELARDEAIIEAKTRERLFFRDGVPNVWELIDANDLKVPEGWER